MICASEGSHRSPVLLTGPVSADGSDARAPRPSLRHYGAAAVLLLAVALTVASSFAHDSPLRQCQDVVATVGEAPVVETCRPLSVTDGPVLLLLTVFLVLLLPDVKSIKIAGVLELEREVKETRTEVEVLGSRVLALSQNFEVNLHVSPGLVERVYERTPESRAEFQAELQRLGPAETGVASPPDTTNALEETGGGETPAADAATRGTPGQGSLDAPTLNATDAELVALLLTLAASIEGVRARAQGLTPARLPEWMAGRKVFYTPRGEQVLRRWLSVFDDEYRVVRSARNALAHGEQLSTTELRTAVQIAAEVLALAYGGVTNKEERDIPDAAVQRAWKLTEEAT